MKNVLFVLGAGAAVDAGFPLGSQLTDKIGELIRNPNWAAHRNVMQLFPDEALRNQMLERLYNSELPTIDDLLTAYRDDAEFVRFGKAVIAVILGSHENQSRLFPMSSKSWYKLLRTQLRLHPQAVVNRSLSFITFNYDRSLEHYLERALVNSNNPKEAVHRFLGSENFVHAHGQLGFLPWQCNGVPHREYSHELAGDHIELAAKGICLPYEDLADVNTRITNLVERADSVYVCGFGFHEANITRAQLRAIRGRKPLFLTQTGMPPQMIERIHREFAPSNAFGSIWDCVNSIFETTPKG